MKNKIIVLLILVITAILFCGCSGQTSSVISSPNTDTSPHIAETPSPAADEKSVYVNHSQALLHNMTIALRNNDNISGFFYSPRRPIF